MSNGRYGMFRESAVSSKRPVVRCKWAATKWSKCSKTCGRGRRTGTRIQTGGKSCTRKRTYRGSCRVKRCPRKCELVLFLFDNVINSPRGEQIWTRTNFLAACKWRGIRWGKCSKSCGGGRRKGLRRQTGGKHCRRRANYKGSCNRQKCPTTKPVKKKGKIPIFYGEAFLIIMNYITM